MAEKQVKQKKTKTKGPKLVVGDYPYVSLMPASRRNAIEVAEAKGKWIRIVILGFILALALSGAAFGFKFMQQLNFNGAEKDAEAVETSISEYEEVDRALSIKQNIENNIVAGTKATIDWQELQERITSNLPASSGLTTFEVVTGGGKDDANTVSVFVNVSSLEPIAYAQILDSFGKVPGIVADSLIIGDLTTGTSGEAGAIYSYPVAFTMDNSILFDRFAYLTEEDAPPAEEPEVIEEEELPVPLPEETEAATQSEEGAE